MLQSNAGGDTVIAYHDQQEINTNVKSECIDSTQLSRTSSSSSLSQLKWKMPSEMTDLPKKWNYVSSSRGFSLENAVLLVPNLKETVASYFKPLSKIQYKDELNAKKKSELTTQSIAKENSGFIISQDTIVESVNFNTWNSEISKEENSENLSLVILKSPPSSKNRWASTASFSDCGSSDNFDNLDLSKSKNEVSKRNDKFTKELNEWIEHGRWLVPKSIPVKSSMNGNENDNECSPSLIKYTFDDIPISLSPLLSLTDSEVLIAQEESLTNTNAKLEFVSLQKVLPEENILKPLLAEAQKVMSSPDDEEDKLHDIVVVEDDISGNLQEEILEDEEEEFLGFEAENEQEEIIVLESESKPEEISLVEDEIEQQEISVLEEENKHEEISVVEDKIEEEISVLKEENKPEEILILEDESKEEIPDDEVENVEPLQEISKAYKGNAALIEFDGEFYSSLCACKLGDQPEIDENDEDEEGETFDEETQQKTIDPNNPLLKQLEKQITADILWVNSVYYNMVEGSIFTPQNDKIYEDEPNSDILNYIKKLENQPRPVESMPSNCVLMKNSDNEDDDEEYCEDEIEYEFICESCSNTDCVINESYMGRTDIFYPFLTPEERIMLGAVEEKPPEPIECTDSFMQTDDDDTAELKCQSQNE